MVLTGNQEGTTYTVLKGFLLSYSFNSCMKQLLIILCPWNSNRPRAADIAKDDDRKHIFKARPLDNKVYCFLFPNVVSAFASKKFHTNRYTHSYGICFLLTDSFK